MILVVGISHASEHDDLKHNSKRDNSSGHVTTILMLKVSNHAMTPQPLPKSVEETTDAADLPTQLSKRKRSKGTEALQLHNGVELKSSGFICKGILLVIAYSTITFPFTPVLCNKRCLSASTFNELAGDESSQDALMVTMLIEPHSADCVSSQKSEIL